MGCHTWFKRPITEAEMTMMKEYAPTEIYRLTGPSDKNKENGMYDKALYESLMKSWKEDVPCVGGYYWWQLGYGSSNPEFESGEASVCILNKKSGLYVRVGELCDLFRVDNYPTKVIRSRRRLRRFLRKDYFKLADWQLDKISKFFRENPGGVITFG